MIVTHKQYRKYRQTNRQTLA